MTVIGVIIITVAGVRRDGGAKGSALGYLPVSYTHLDVYKRQAQGKPGAKARPKGVVDAHTVEIP